jgi:L-alanine-DL-glutamate epimerase-like enolase superfamily enzyme
MRPTDIRVKEVRHSYQDFRYRTPIKFGGQVLDRVTLLNVEMDVETGSGVVATGAGSMPLGNVWAWPSKELGYEQTLGGMKFAASHLLNMYDGAAAGHPVAITHGLERQFAWIADVFTTGHQLADPMPLLAVLVVASAFDAALHDAFGKAHGRSAYHCYGPDLLDADLGSLLGPDFAGDRLDRYLSRRPEPRLPLYHLVGALDPLTRADVRQPVGDGLPETLGEWVERDGLTHLKIKLSGDDLGWDVERVIRVNVTAEKAWRRLGVAPGRYSLDFNERCPSVEHLLLFFTRLRQRAFAAFDRVQYVEQPTHRDLKAHPLRVHEAAKLKPVVIDESLTDLESLHLARDLGYTGVAFKACKGQTQTLLLAAAAQKLGMFRCVQDLTCPGASLIHSAGLAAHIPGVAAIEANSRQYVPAANAGWDEQFPGLFTTRDGTLHTGQLTGPGLGAY